MSEFIATDLRDGVLEIRLNRPQKKNALTDDMYGALAAAFARPVTEEGIGAVLFRGGAEIFSAGNDLSGFADMGREGGGDPAVIRFIHAVRQCPVPVVAAVNGAAIGIGATILLHCDLVYARADAYLHMPFTDLAAVPEAGSSFILPRRFGRQIAAEFLLLSRKIGAERAMGFGLLTAIAGDPDAEAADVAKGLAAKPPQSMRKTKALMFGDDGPLARHIDREMEIFRECTRSAEMQETIARMVSRSG